MNMKEIKEIFLHKIAFIKIRNSNIFLTNNISLYRTIMHDTIKMILVVLIGDRKATKYHKKRAGHHTLLTYKDRVEAFCDWECAKYTKPDKPLNGSET